MAVCSNHVLARAVLVLSILCMATTTLYLHERTASNPRNEHDADSISVVIDSQKNQLRALSLQLKAINQTFSATTSHLQGDLNELVDRDSKLEAGMTELWSHSVENKEILNQLQSKIDHLPQTTKTNTTKTQQMRQLKVHLWDDQSGEDYKPREEILIKEGWFEYPQGNQSWFVPVEDPKDADLILWITTMARHELEIPPIEKAYKHKVIVLDYADGCTLHMTRNWMRGNETLLGYYRRSFVYKDVDNVYKENCTNPEDQDIVKPYAFSGTKAMMIPHNSKFAKPDYAVKLFEEGIGTIYRNKNNKNLKNNKDRHKLKTKQHNDHGYFEDVKYDNFLIPFSERKWTITSILKKSEYTNDHNTVRTKIIEWTEEFSLSKTNSTLYGPKDPSFASYVGLVRSGCDGHCFGQHYLRHLRDAKIVVTCNPTFYEGDYRQYESFLSGAMVFIDEMVVPSWMPHPFVSGQHLVTYNPKNKTDFLQKLAYYTDPANAHITERIAKAGYEWVLKHHMPGNRVDYILQGLSDKLEEHVKDPSARARLGLSLP